MHEELFEDHIDVGEALGVHGQLLLHLVRTDEEGLEVRPLALRLGHLAEHVRDGRELLLPADDERLEGGEVLRGHHALHHELILLEHLEILLGEIDQVHFDVARGHLRLKAKLDHRPCVLELEERLLHLVLLVGLVDHLADVVHKLVQLELEHVGEAKGRVELVVHDGDRRASDLHELLPMALAHGWGLKLRDARHRDEEVLDDAVDAQVDVPVAHRLVHALDDPLEALGLLLERCGVDLVPEQLLPLEELEEDHLLEVPERLAQDHVLAHVGDRLLDLVGALGELEEGAHVDELEDLALALDDADRVIEQLRVRLLGAVVNLEDDVVEQLLTVLREVGLELGDVAHHGLGLSILQRLDLLADEGCRLGRRVEIVLHLVELLLDWSNLAHVVGHHEVERILRLVDKELDLDATILDELEARHDILEAPNVALHERGALVEVLVSLDHLLAQVLESLLDVRGHRVLEVAPAHLLRVEHWSDVERVHNLEQPAAHAHRHRHDHRRVGAGDDVVAALGERGSDAAPVDARPQLCLHVETVDVVVVSHLLCSGVGAAAIDV